MTTPAKNLRDPKTCGEDLLAIANRAADIAKTNCDGCTVSHWRVPAQRAVGLPESLATDRCQIVDAVRTIWKRPAPGRKFEIVIAGAADTGLLAAVAHAVAVSATDALGHTHFTVVDRCRTPLLLCAEFSSLHGIDCSTIASDLRTVTPDRQSDLVVMHSVLRFLPSEERILFLQRARGWLRLGGQLLVSNSFGPQTESQRAAKIEKNEASSLRIKQAFASGLLRSPVTLDQLQQAQQIAAMSAVNRDRVFISVHDIERMAVAAGFGIAQLDFIHAPNLKPDVPGRSRVLAILSPAETKGTAPPDQ
jgi:hypothetical protein